MAGQQLTPVLQATHWPVHLCLCLSVCLLVCAEVSQCDNMVTLKPLSQRLQVKQGKKSDTRA